MRRFPLFLSFVLLLSSGLSHGESFRIEPFDRPAWEKINAAHQGQEWIVHIWAVSCSACVKELPIWAKSLRYHKTSRIVFLQADAAPLNQVRSLLKQFGLASGEHYSANEELEDQLRFAVFPSWQGETPATLIIRRSGEKSWTLGALNEQQVTDLLKSLEKQ